MSEPQQFISGALRGVLRHDVAMSKHTSWRAGGVAQQMYQPADLADLQNFLLNLPSDEPIYPVGLGSNLLVRDGGVRGTVLLMHGVLNALRLESDNTLYVEAGVPGAKLARFAAAHHLSGAAFFAGIPGTMGGMLAMNAGCYGSETWQHVVSVRVLTHDGQLFERAAAEYRVAYRYAQHKVNQNEIFVAALLKFMPGDGVIARLQIRELLSKRIASQPLNFPNAGSVFRNPPNDYAAHLIEQCGLKGKRIGGAQVSEKHANFIVNLGGATAADIEDLINHVRADVLQKTGVALHPEVRIIGERS